MGLPIDVDGLSHVYRTESGTINAIDEFDFTIAAGEVVSLVGPTGCGKSTLLNIVLGVLSPTSGVVTIDGERPYENFYHFRGVISAVFQEARLLPWRNAISNAKLGLEALDVEDERQDEIVRGWFEKLGLTGYEDTYPQELSGGMRQRVAIARAYAIDPDVLLLDEPFGHLDEVTATRLRNDLIDLISNRDDRITGLFITHNIDEALLIGDRVLVSDAPGYVVGEFSVPDDIEERPVLFKEYKDDIIDLLD